MRTYIVHSFRGTDAFDIFHCPDVDARLHDPGYDDAQTLGGESNPGRDFHVVSGLHGLDVAQALESGHQREYFEDDVVHHVAGPDEPSYQSRQHSGVDGQVRRGLHQPDGHEQNDVDQDRDDQTPPRQLGVEDVEECDTDAENRSENAAVPPFGHGLIRTHHDTVDIFVLFLLVSERDFEGVP